MSHQAYGPRTAVPRLLRILDRQAIRATFFIPGYSAERWPAAVRAIRDAGHEIAHHGYLHEGARSAPDAETEERRLLRGARGARRGGGRPAGRLPGAELGALLPTAGAPRPPWLPVRQRADGRRPSVPAGDGAGARRAVDRRAARRTGASTTGSRTTTCPGSPAPGVIASPADVIARWTLELEALVDEGGLFMLTNHPFVSGRASRAAGLERLIARAREIDGLWIATAAEIAAHVATLPPRARRPRAALAAPAGLTETGGPRWSPPGSL